MIMIVGVDDYTVAKLDARICAELFAGDAPQLVGSDAVAAQKPSDPVRMRIARPAVVAQQHTATTAAQNQRGAESGRSSTDDDHIIHRDLPPTPLAGGLSGRWNQLRPCCSPV